MNKLFYFLAVHPVAQVNSSQTASSALACCESVDFIDCASMALSQTLAATSTPSPAIRPKAHSHTDTDTNTHTHHTAHPTTTVSTQTLAPLAHHWKLSDGKYSNMFLMWFVAFPTQFSATLLGCFVLSSSSQPGLGWVLYLCEFCCCQWQQCSSTTRWPNHPTTSTISGCRNHNAGSTLKSKTFCRPHGNAP